MAIELKITQWELLEKMQTDNFTQEEINKINNILNNLDQHK